MTGLAYVLAIALLPAAGNLLGILIAELFAVAARFIGAALHAAAGIAIAVVSIELVPAALPMTPPWLFVSAFCVGAILSVLIARGVSRARRSLGAAGSSGSWMVYVAVGSDLLVDGLMIGIGSAVSGGLGLLVALSQVVGNIPGGFAAIANFRGHGVSRTVRLVAGATFVVPVLVGTVSGFLLLRDAGEAAKHAALVFAAGILLLATVEDVVPQADEPRASRWLTTVWFTAGFALFALLALYID